MKQLIDGKWFCEPRDIPQINANTLRSYLHRSKTAQDPTWHNIPNPQFNGKNSRRLILIDSIPNPSIRLQVLKKLEISLENQSEALKLASSQGLEALAKTATESTSQMLRNNASYLATHLKDYIEKKHVSLVGHFMQFSINTQRMVIYARTASLAAFVVDQVKDIHLQWAGEPVRAKQDYRSFRMNLITVLENHITDLPIPSSDQRFKKWCEEMLVAAAKEPTNPADWIQVTRVRNNNRSRFTNEQKKLAEEFYLQDANPYKRVYDMLLERGRQKGWWIVDGCFDPITYQTLCNYLNENKEKLDLQRNGRMAWKVANVPSATRDYPEMTNMVWGIDGTAHNEWVIDERDASGKARQKLQVIRVFDYASLRLLATVPYIGGEKGEYFTQAYRRAVLACGYRPKWIQTDQGPGYDIVKAWCKERDLALVPASVGLSRAKLVENLLGRMDQMILRHALKAWSGLNLTAQGHNSRLRGDNAKRSRSSARSILKAAHWTVNDAMEEWNALVIEQLNHRSCNKTPIELWNEKESATDPLHPQAAAVWFGEHHEIKLSIHGVKVQHTDSLGYAHQYIYFPSSLESPEDIDRTINIFQRLPHTSRKAVKVHLYITEYGQPAHVFEHAFSGSQPPKYLGEWVLKPNISMVAALTGQTEMLERWKLFVKQYEEKARNYIQQVRETVTSMEDQEGIAAIKADPLASKKRKVKANHPFDKDELREEEELFKLADGDESAMEEMRTLVDPDTGEEILVPKTNKR